MLLIGLLFLILSISAVGSVILISLSLRLCSFNTRELIYFLRTNPQFAQTIGFDPINNFIPSEATFSIFKKKFDTSFLFEIIAQSVK